VGIRARNGAIAVDPKGKPVPTCLEDARDAGRRTGLVTTTRITHATPASFAAHVVNRGMEAMIAIQYVRESEVDLLFGGGARFFPPKLLEEARDEGYSVIRTPDELAKLPDDTSRVLGLFAESHVPYVLDRDAPGEETAPTLVAMTEKALALLGKGEKGFFLMIEGGRIDHAGHGNDAPSVLAEMREFDATVGAALAYQAKHPDTLVVVTADHETGGLSIGYASGVPLLPANYLAMAKTERTVLAELQAAGEQKTVEADVIGVGRKGFYPPYSYWPNSVALERSARFGMSFGTQGHTTTPVTVAAVGPGHERFAGMHHNSHVGKLLREWMSK
jgi:alkaline phosphatase